MSARPQDGVGTPWGQADDGPNLFVACGTRMTPAADASAVLHTGAKVVWNNVGTFAGEGHEVVEAGVEAGCHYVDTPGQQDWVMECYETNGERFFFFLMMRRPRISPLFPTAALSG